MLRGSPKPTLPPFATPATRSDADNAAIISRIASISIVGTATAAGENVTHAFTAEQIVKMKVGAIVLPFDAIPANQSIEVGGPSANLLAREIAL